MKQPLLIMLAATLCAVGGCGGGAYDFTLKRATDSALDDFAKCGAGKYWVPPAASAPASDHGKCYEYEVVPASAPAASAPAVP